MADIEHEDVPPGENHGSLRGTFDDAAARLAYVCTAADLSQRRIFRQTDTGRSYAVIATGAGAGSWELEGRGDLGGSLGADDNRVLRADGAGGLTAQGSPVTIADDGTVTGAIVGTPATNPEIANKGYADAAVNARVVPFGIWQSNGNPANTSVNWMPRAGNIATVTLGNAISYIVAPCAMTLVSITAAYWNAVQATDSITYSVDIDGVNHPELSCTITPTSGAQTGTHAGVAVAQGSQIAIRVVKSGSTASTSGSLVSVTLGVKS